MRLQEDEMDKACGIYGGKIGRNEISLEGTGTDGRKILKWFLNK
jgi:hypothetical protein